MLVPSRGRRQGADRADIEIGRCRAGTAVDREGDGPGRFARVRETIGDEGDLCLEFSALIHEGKAARGGGKAKKASIRQGDTVLGGDVGGKLASLWAPFGGPPLLRLVGTVGGLRHGGLPGDEEHGGQDECEAPGAACQNGPKPRGDCAQFGHTTGPA